MEATVDGTVEAGRRFNEEPETQQWCRADIGYDQEVGQRVA